MSFEYCWRWFGPNDPIGLEAIRQTGVSGVVTALHHIPVGTVWSVDEIENRKRMIGEYGMRWSVVESVPVHEAIKKRSADFHRYVDTWKNTMVNLARCGIKRICYNFMPVLDWSRTDLRVVMPDQTVGTAFSALLLRVFDLFLLCRPGALTSYSPEEILEAESHFRRMRTHECRRLTATVLLGLPGSLETRTLDQLKQEIAAYRDIDTTVLQANLSEFLREIVPVAEELGVRLAIHPDDPPWSLMGLPRIVGNEHDLEYIMRAIDSPANGITFCTGSLGAGFFNDVPALAKQYASRINFTHIRNVRRTPGGDFTETHLLDGDLDIYAIVRVLIDEQQRRYNEGRDDHCIPLRPDHGLLMNAEKRKRGVYPGYSLMGRLRGLAELRGMALGIERSIF